MKNLKVYKKAIAIVAAGSILLLSGCSSNQNTNNAETTTNEEAKNCRHLTVYFADTPITFKECEGYDIHTHRHGNSSEIEYEVLKNNVELFDGATSIYNSYIVNHDAADEIIDEQSVQKTK